MRLAKKAFRFKRIGYQTPFKRFWEALVIALGVLSAHLQSFASEPTPCNGEILKTLHDLQTQESIPEGLNKSKSTSDVAQSLASDLMGKHPDSIRLATLQYGANKARAELTTAGAVIKDSEKLPYLGLLAEDKEIQVLGLKTGKKLSDQLKGSLLRVEKLPSKVGKATSKTRALFHPEMAEYKKRLEDLGYELVVDESLSHTGVEAYVDQSTKTLALTSTSNWPTFRHEFQHAEFQTFIAQHYSNASIAIKDGKNLREVLPDSTLAALPSKQIDELEKLMKKELPQKATNETLSVQEELKAMGFRSYLPGRGVQVRLYALRHQAQGILDIYKSGQPVSATQKEALESAMKQIKILKHFKFWEKPILVAVGAGTVGATTLAPTAHRKIEEFEKNHDEILKDVFGEFIYYRTRIIFYKDDGTLVGVTDDGTFVAPTKSETSSK